MWSSALALTLKSIVVNGGSLTSVYDDAGYLVRIGQVGSGMEVLHSILGFVPSPVLTALMQWAGRTHVLMSVVHAIPALHATNAAALMFLAWSLTEVIRYPTYAFGSKVPSWLNYLRYTVFIPLYPIGGPSEIWLMVNSLPTMDAKQMYTITMPNAINFAFHYPTFLRGLIVVYPYLVFKLYAYMFHQRKKKLSGGGRTKRD